MTPVKNRDENLAVLEQRYGKPIAETRLKEPQTDGAGGKGVEYALLEFGS